jgi:hypothetical protein
MNASLRISAVLRRTFGIYASQASVLLTAAIVLDAIVVLDRVSFKSSPALAIAAVPVNLVLIGLFVCVVVLIVADVYDGGRRRGARELLRGAWLSLGPLLLVGVLALLAITLLTSVASTILFVIIGGVALSAGVGVLGLIIGLLLVPVLLLIPELFLFTIWSVLAAVTVLERSGGLRAFARSRELVRGNGWRVLALILMLAFPLALATGELDRATRLAGATPATAVGLLVIAALITPIPALASTALYFELRRTEPNPAHADPTPPVALAPSTSLPTPRSP